MSNRSQGTKYEETKNLSDVEIAKLIREDIKAAVKAGTLPKGIKCSVRKTNSCAIDISIRAWPGTVCNEERLAHDHANPNVFVPYYQMPLYTAEIEAAVSVLKQIHASYNYDNSDLMTDYFDTRFYGTAHVDWHLADAERKAYAAAHASAA